MVRDDLESRVRLAAFAFLDQLRASGHEALRRTDLEAGFSFEGHRVPLVGPQGIFKPALLSRIPISITTKAVVEGQPRPYEDGIGPDGHIRYRYRDTRGRPDPMHHDNVGLRLAMTTKTPLIYFFGLVPGRYKAEYPVFIERDDASEMAFSVAVDDPRFLATQVDGVAESEAAGRRAYITRVVVARMHQRSFRERVLAAYRQCCAICSLRHEELLDAAHILSDKHPKGEPWVRNGLALCKIHHAAFDENILGIRPDLVIEVREDILKEKDGPMLEHGIQNLDRTKLVNLPQQEKLMPSPDFLEERFEEFRRAV